MYITVGEIDVWRVPRVGGVPRGSVDVESVSCVNRTCRIRVPAPGLALVFLTSEDEAALVAGAADTLLPTDGATRTATIVDPPTRTFGTTVWTEEVVGVTADPAAVATSNGQRGSGALGRTAKWRAVNGARHRRSGEASSLVVRSAGSCRRVGALEPFISFFSVVNLSFQYCSCHNKSCRAHWCSIF